MSTNNEIEITISDKKDSNDCNSDETIQTIHTNEVPLNPIESSFSPESESSPKLDCNTNSDEMNDQKASCEESPKSKSIDDNIDDDNKLSNTNNCQKDSQTSVDSVKEKRHQYSKEQLIAISKLSLARKRPQCLDNSFNNPSNGLWDPEKWMSSRFPNNGSNNSSVKYNFNKRERQSDGNEMLPKRSNSDPRDRLVEEEKDNIILSPQRGSFGTGCHVSTTSFSSSKVSDNRNRDHHQERSKIDESSEGPHRTNSSSHREQRRVGTGRILPKDRERANDWTERSYERERNFDHRNDNRDNRNDDYNDRRKGRFSYDNNSRRGNATNTRNNRFENENLKDNYRNSRDEDEPEWFTGGPTSKHETIELKGFDDECDDKKSTKEDVFAEKSTNRKSNEKVCDSNTDNQTKSSPQKQLNSSPNNNDFAQQRDRDNSVKSDDFDVNDMFKMNDWFSDVNETRDNKLISSMDVISNTATNDCDINAKSRFKRWFKESPSNAQTSQFNNDSQNDSKVMNAFNNKHLNISQIDSRSESSANRSMPSTYQQSNQNVSQNPSKEKNILDLLQGANRTVSFDQLVDRRDHNKFDPSKVKNVSEIEASLKQLEMSDKSQEEDKKAFEKLITELGKRTSSNPTFYENMNTIKDKQTEAIILPTNTSKIIIPNTRQQMLSAPTILELLKEEENQAAFEALADSHVEHYSKLQPNSSLNQLNRSTAQMFIKNDKLVINSANSLNSQNWQNATQPHINPTQARIPSPQELAEHTQHIFRDVLIKRNIEQRDKLLKSQPVLENIRNTTPTKGMSNSKISFTPTSVIRKNVELVSKSGTPYNEMRADIQTTSQQKFINDQLLMSSAKTLNTSSPRPILKSNDPFGQQAMPTNKASLQSPVSPQQNISQFNTNAEQSFAKYFDKQQQQLILQQQIQQQNSQQASIMAQRQLNPSAIPSAVRSTGAPLSLASTLQSGAMIRPSSPSPNSSNNLQSQAIRNMSWIQDLKNNPNIRSNISLQQLNQMMAIQQQQQQSAEDARHFQSMNRAVQPMQMLFNTSNAANNQSFINPPNSSSSTGIAQNISRSDLQYCAQFESPMNRNISEQSRPSISSTYQPRQQIFMNSGNAQSRHLGQWFGNEMLNQKLPDMPPVPLQNALTLEDLERP